jgi:ABC-type glycerol-3-phosphate transport system substrate-binding protein
MGLAGCTGGGDGGQESYELEYWTWTVVVPAMQSAVEQYNQESSHTVNVRKMDPGNVEDLLITAMRTGEDMPDASQIFGRQFKYRGVEQGGFTPMPAISDLEEDFAPIAEVQHAVQVDGEKQWYGMPQTQGGLHLTYNVEVFEEAGLPTDPVEVEEEIQTWSQYVEAGQQVKDETGKDMVALDYQGYANTLVGCLAKQAGGWLYNWDGEFEWNSRRNRIAFETLMDIKSVSTEARRNTGRYWDLLRNNEVASIPGTSWLLAYTLENAPETSGRWRIARPPVFEEIDNCPRAGINHGGQAIVPQQWQDVNQDRHKVAIDMVQSVNTSKAGLEGKLDNLYMGLYLPEEYRNADDILTKEYDDVGGQQRNKWLMNSVWMAPTAGHEAPNEQVSNLIVECARQIMGEEQPVQETLDEYHERMVPNMEGHMSVNFGKGAGNPYPGHDNDSIF